MGLLDATPDNLNRWSRLGLVSATGQTVAMILLLNATAEGELSWGMLVCTLCSLVFTAGYLRYRAALASRSWRVVSHSTKYFLVAHLSFGTWYALLAQITFSCHAVGLRVLVALLDSDPTNDLTPPARRLATPFFAAVVASVALDVYAIVYHTRRMDPPPGPVHVIGGPWDVLLGRAAGCGDAQRGGRPRIAATATVLLDAVLFVLTAAALSLHRDMAALLLLALVAVSLVCQARYAWQAWRGVGARAGASPTAADAAAESEWHVTSQLLALQHNIIVALVFLVNLLLLLLHSVGRSFPSVVADGEPLYQALQVLSLVAYAGIAATTVVLVGLHSQMEHAGARGAGLAEDGSGVSYATSPSAMPVALLQLDSSGAASHSSYGGEELSPGGQQQAYQHYAVPVPASWAASPVPVFAVPVPLAYG